MTIVTISARFQVVIPQAIREALGLEPGHKMCAMRYEDRIELIPVRPMPSLRGTLQGIDTTIEREDN